MGLTRFVVFVISVRCLIHNQMQTAFWSKEFFVINQQSDLVTRRMNSLNVGKLRFIIASLKGLSTHELGAELDRLCVGSGR